MKQNQAETITIDKEEISITFEDGKTYTVKRSEMVEGT